MNKSLNEIDTAALDEAVRTVMPDVIYAMRTGSVRTYTFAIEAYRSDVVAEYRRIRAARAS